MFSFPAGNKSDLVEDRKVLFEEACTLAENNSVLAALETSAKEAQNVEAAFNLMARELLARNGMTIVDESPQDQSQFMLRNSSHPIHGFSSADKKCGCWASVSKTSQGTLKWVCVWRGAGEGRQFLYEAIDGI